MAVNPDLKIGTGCTVCTEASIIGDVTIGSGTVVHPRAQIIAEAGPIIIGDNNLIEENSCIINRHKPENEKSATMNIGNDNVFEIACKCEALLIGDSNVVESYAIVGPDVELTTGCIIGTMCELVTQETLPPNTVIVGRDCHRRINAEKPALQTSQLEYLRKVLPNYHYLVANKK